MTKLNLVEKLPTPLALSVAAVASATTRDGFSPQKPLPADSLPSSRRHLAFRLPVSAAAPKPAPTQSKLQTPPPTTSPSLHPASATENQSPSLSPAQSPRPRFAGQAPASPRDRSRSHRTP